MKHSFTLCLPILFPLGCKKEEKCQFGLWRSKLRYSPLEMAQIMNGADANVMDDGYNDYGDVQADFGYSNMAVPMGFTEMACMSFDHRENLLWVVDKSGHVLSYYRVVLQVYSRFFWPLDKNDTEAHSIVPTSDHVIVIGKCTIAAFSRGGVPEYFYRSDLLTDLSCAHWDPYTNLLFLGGSQDTIVVYDIEIRSERNVIPIKEGSASIIRTTERYLVSASEDGKLTVRSKDLMNYNLIAQTQAHLGKVVDFDVHATYLVCCGMSKKSNGTLVFDNFLKVYDVRNLNPQIPIPFNRHPTVCKFVGIDSLNEEKVVVTSGPMLFLVDILENKLTGLGSLPVPASHLCASDSHQAIAVGMGECPPMVQLFWTEDEDPPFSICDIDPIFPAEDEKDIPIPYDAPTPLATFPLRYCPGMDYCSDRWPDVLMRRRFLKTALDFDTEKAQAMGYIKSPYAQTLVAGFNVWQFDDEEDPVIKKREKPRVLQTITNIGDKEQDLFPCRDKNMIIGPISTQKPIEINQLSARFNATSIMSRFQDAPEFVPGRSLHTSHANLDDTRRLTPEPQSTQKKDVSIEKSASNKSLNVETENQKPSADRLPNMSFDELRILAAEMRKQKEKSAEAEEGKDENKEELKEKEEEDS